MKSAADYFIFKFNEKKIRKQIDSEISNLNKGQNKKIRLTLNKWGVVKIEVTDIPELNQNISVIISQNKINSSDMFRHFKTTNRKLYDDEHLNYSSERILRSFIFQ